MQYLLKQARAREVTHHRAVFQNQNYNTSLHREILPLQRLCHWSDSELPALGNTHSYYEIRTDRISEKIKTREEIGTLMYLFYTTYI